MIDLTHLVDELASVDGGDRDAMVSRLASGPKSRRQELIHAEFYYIEADEPDKRPGSLRASVASRHGNVEAQTAAAIEIQRIFRGYLTRKQTPPRLQSGDAVARFESKNMPRPDTAEKPTKEAADPSEDQPKTTDLRRNTIQVCMETEFQRKFPGMEISAFSCKESTNFPCKDGTDVSNKDTEDVPCQDVTVPGKLHGDATVTPQAVSPEESSQATVKTPRPPSKVMRYDNITPYIAALIIQRAWRRHIDVQVFHYYKDLINFKHKGDPALMLKCINPIESKLLDAAAGVHIKFRLAGHQFPPNIYYKIFTHRPVQDLCANSPKDYTKACHKRKLARYVHNKTDIILPQNDSSGWYKRHENNGWRLVSDRLMQTYLNDQTTYMTSMKKTHFSHTKLLRKEDVERKKKQKKIDWMRKMYKKGMLKAKVDDPETIGLINGAAAGMLATVDALGVDAIHNWEVDELLDWTTGLNFDDYWTTWKELGTSAKSEKPVEDQKMLVSTSSKDPFELSVSATQTRSLPSTRLSHNTPVSNQSVTSIPY